MEQQMWHNFVTTQTQLQLNSKLEFDKKMTLDHHQSHFHVAHFSIALFMRITKIALTQFPDDF